MHLRHPQDDLIQDYVDGNLDLSQRRIAEALLENDPTAKEAAEQYRMIQRSLPQPKLSESADEFVESIMSRLPRESRLPIVVRQYLLRLTILLSAAAAIITLADLTNFTSWLDKSLLPKMTVFSRVAEAIASVADQLNGSLPILTVAVLVVLFYGLLDRVISRQKT